MVVTGVIVINTTHYKTVKDFVKFVLTFKNEKDLADWFEEDRFTVGDFSTMSNKVPLEKVCLWTIAANALMFKKYQMLSEELQRVNEF